MEGWLLPSEDQDAAFLSNDCGPSRQDKTQQPGCDLAANASQVRDLTGLEGILGRELDRHERRAAAEPDNQRAEQACPQRYVLSYS